MAAAAGRAKAAAPGSGNGSGGGSGQGSGAPSAPTVTSLSASSGSIAGGTPVTITGTNFTGATSVMFGTTAVGFTVLSPNAISAVISPAMPREPPT